MLMSDKNHIHLIFLEDGYPMFPQSIINGFAIIKILIGRMMEHGKLPFLVGSLQISLQPLFYRRSSDVAAVQYCEMGITIVKRIKYISIACRTIVRQSKEISKKFLVMVAFGRHHRYL